MACSFRYLNTPDARAVTLRMFRLDGLPRAEVTGPLLDDNTIRPAVDRCIASLTDGFDLAIRIANSTDTEIVVTGDRALWLPRWGELLDEPARAPASVSVLPGID